jgi:hypothetical protein
VPVFPCAIMITTAPIVFTLAPILLRKAIHDGRTAALHALIRLFRCAAGRLTLTGDANVAHVYTLEWKVVVEHIISGKIIL